jgi:hypothetical protein
MKAKLFSNLFFIGVLSYCLLWVVKPILNRHFSWVPTYIYQQYPSQNMLSQFIGNYIRINGFSLYFAPSSSSGRILDYETLGDFTILTPSARGFRSTNRTMDVFYKGKLVLNKTTGCFSTNIGDNRLTVEMVNEFTHLLNNTKYSMLKGLSSASLTNYLNNKPVSHDMHN